MSVNNGEGAKKIRKPDDHVYCMICGEALRYDREGKVWRTLYVDEPTQRCYSLRLGAWDHQPRPNPSRLIRAAKRYNDKRRMGLT